MRIFLLISPCLSQLAPSKTIISKVSLQKRLVKIYTKLTFKVPNQIFLTYRLLTFVLEKI